MTWYLWLIVAYMVANAAYICTTYDKEIHRTGVDVAANVAATAAIVWLIIDLATC